MREKDTKRSSGEGISASPDIHTGVGGRHTDHPLPDRGGGYQDFYNSAGFPLNEKIDPRLIELREIGLSRAWLKVAETIGVDSFLAAWKVLDHQTKLVNPGQREVYVPLFSSYLRFQRNRFILALADQDVSVDQIRKMVRSSLCESISARHITRIIARFKLPA